MSLTHYNFSCLALTFLISISKGSILIKLRIGQVWHVHDVSILAASFMYKSVMLCTMSALVFAEYKIASPQNLPINLV